MSTATVTNANISLVGVQKDQYAKQPDGAGAMDSPDDGEFGMVAKPDKRNNPYGFDSLRKDFEEGVSEVVRVQALKNVSFSHTDMQRYEYH
jgi:hypothetical protein